MCWFKSFWFFWTQRPGSYLFAVGFFAFVLAYPVLAAGFPNLFLVIGILSSDSLQCLSPLSNPLFSKQLF